MVYHKTINGVLSSMKGGSVKGGSVKELKVLEEEKIILKDKNNNITVIPQKKLINENKISQEKLNRFVNLKLKF